MCDPLSLTAMALGAGASLFVNKSAPPPPPAKPVAPPHTEGAEVRVGDGAKKDALSATPQYEGFTEKRVTGSPLGGLGKGGLGL